MPIYQYKCSDCGHQLEALQKMSDAKLVDCPECKSPSLRKQLTAAAFKLNGTGWYETDFKNSGKKPAAKSSDGLEKSTDKESGTSKSDSDSATNKTVKSTENKANSSSNASQ